MPELSHLVSIWSNMRPNLLFMILTTMCCLFKAWRPGMAYLRWTKLSKSQTFASNRINRWRLRSDFKSNWMAEPTLPVQYWLWENTRNRETKRQHPKLSELFREQNTHKAINNHQRKIERNTCIESFLVSFFVVLLTEKRAVFIREDDITHLSQIVRNKVRRYMQYE